MFGLRGLYVNSALPFATNGYILAKPFLKNGMLRKLPPITRNFYFIASVVFLFWMLFIDSSDFISQYQLSNKLKSLEAQRDFFNTKIEEVRKDREELLSDDKMLEKFAREKYYMKKETEDVFVIFESDE